MERGGSWECSIPEITERRDRGGERYIYRLESYQEHIRWVWQAFERVAWPEAAGAAARMERVFGWPQGSVRRAAELAVLLHDVGKLSVGWQEWARAWQKALGNPMPEGMVAAHTEYDSARDWERVKYFSPRRPPHAGEGAYACLPILVRCLEQHEALVPAAYTAVLRHHTPFAEDNQDYRLIAEASDQIAATLNSAPDCVLPVFAKPQSGQRADQFVCKPEDEPAFLAYLIIVRVLRRADQIGTEWGMSI